LQRKVDEITPGKLVDPLAGLEAYLGRDEQDLAIVRVEALGFLQQDQGRGKIAVPFADNPRTKEEVGLIGLIDRSVGVEKGVRLEVFLPLDLNAGAHQQEAGVVRRLLQYPGNVGIGAVPVTQAEAESAASSANGRWVGYRDARETASL
jgi:hypothetical protein